MLGGLRRTWARSSVRSRGSSGPGSCEPVAWETLGWWRETRPHPSIDPSPSWCSSRSVRRRLAEEFAEIAEVGEIYIFGSWADRYQGAEGLTPADVDVLIIGSPDRDEVYQAALRAEHRLGREVNATIRSKTSWQAARDGFLKQVRSSPLVRVTGSGGEGEPGE